MISRLPLSKQSIKIKVELQQKKKKKKENFLERVRRVRKFKQFIVILT